MNILTRTVQTFGIAIMLMAWTTAAHATSLIDLVAKGDVQGVKAAIAHGADVNVKNKYGDTPISWASRNGHADVVKMLLDHGVKINDKNELLRDASMGGLLWLVRDMLAKDANVNATNKWGRTALYGASWEGHTDVVKLLLTHNANVNARNKDGDTPLRWAAWKGHSEIVKILLTHGAKISDKNEMLRNAAGGGLLWLVQDMLTKGADVNAEDQYGNTPLHWASMKNHADVVRLLLTHNANVNVRNRNGKTPLMVAKTDKIKHLLESKMSNAVLLY